MTMTFDTRRHTVCVHTVRMIQSCARSVQYIPPGTSVCIRQLFCLAICDMQTDMQDLTCTHKLLPLREDMYGYITNHLSTYSLTMATKPLSETLLEAIVHNNDGVLLIECGCYQEARDILQIALKQTRTVVHAMKKDGIIPKQTRSSRFRWAQAAPLDESLSDSFIFRRGLTMILPVDEIELSNCKAESTTMLYNLGLSFHLEGASNAKNIVLHSKMLGRALECYRVAVSMRQQHQTNASSSRLIPGEQLFDIGLANNVAEIHLYFMNHNEAVVFYAAVSDTLAHVKDMLPANEMNGFSLNLVAFGLPRMAAAA